MTRLSLAPKTRYEGQITGYLESFSRRVQAMPPGACPLNVVLSMLETGMCSSCGKCTPCREGLFRLVDLLREVREYRAQLGALDEIEEIARTVQASADCVIGYDTASMVLKSLNDFSQEYLAHVEERKCLDGTGQTVPCETLCPAHVNVPAYIALIGENDYDGAIKMIRKDNPFPTACALVCEHPCEERCRRAIIDAPLNIRGLKKFAVDQLSVDKVSTPTPLASTGKRVAVVGAGPSGLTCAYYLALMGHEVTVFEARKKLGGMLRYGIPKYRFPRERLDEDINAILHAGNITVQVDCTIDAQKMEELSQSYDAVYVAIGAHVGKTLRIPNSDAKGVSSAVDLLRGIGDDDYPDFRGKKVVVVGGGNVAMDCARTSVRAGADEVSVVYRRRLEDMTALPSEIESALAEGVEMLVLESPSSIEVDGDGRVSALLTQPQMISAVKRGRPAPVDANKPQNRIPADIILVAIGQDVVSAPFAEFGMQTEWGCFNATESLQSPDMPGIYVGGDCQTGPASAIMAIAAGKVAAFNIDEYLGFRHMLDYDVASPSPRPNNAVSCGRVNITERPARERKLDFEYVENPMSFEEAMQESSRCLRCDHYGCGSVEGGRVQYD